MAIQDRIIELMELLDLTHSEFADEINVQRSSISHLVSGRNKPSMDFIEKVHQRYPDLNTDWLLFGKGLPFSQVNKNTQNTSLGLFDEEKSDLSSNKEAEPTKESLPYSEIPTEEKIIRNSQSTSKPIDKVIIFYSDGSFEAFQAKST